ncbi:MAG: TonB family protein [Steroidobacteraceae bacterium]
MSGLAGVLAEGSTLRREQAPAFLAVIAVHGLAAWALLSANSVRDVLLDVMPPLVVSLIDARQEPEAFTPPPAEPRLEVTPLAVIAPLPDQVEVAVAPTDAPRTQTVAAAVVTEREVTERPLPSASPRTISASAVEYVVSPKPAYPLYSRRAKETGVVMLRVLIDDGGLPAQIVIEKSSGFPRLDEAALAAMRGARFKPHTENGRTLAVWAPAPIIFEL